jgi:hypothetical protein
MLPQRLACLIRDVPLINQIIDFVWLPGPDYDCSWNPNGLGRQTILENPFETIRDLSGVSNRLKPRPVVETSNEPRQTSYGGSAMVTGAVLAWELYG